MARRTLVAEASTAIETQRPVVIFPEGTRGPHGERPELRPGFAGLYRALGLPVVPIAHDSGKLWPRGLTKRPGTIRFKVGETIPAGLKRDEVEARVRAAINALNS
jgi:1-acyl-sn-glycerol-3-phosphate acyltransferase